MFEDLGHERLRPTLDFVCDWLKEERRRIVAQVQWSFVVAMLATILAVQLRMLSSARRHSSRAHGPCWTCAICQRIWCLATG